MDFIFGSMYQELIQKDGIDPFAAAAWVSHTFVTIHPFEDGNGRMSRMLASIPLLRSKLPPLCVENNFLLQPYIEALNKTRATPRLGDYATLMKRLFYPSLSSLENVEMMLKYSTFASKPL
ncbi:hypothetical protein V5O48_000473 [Marasmius crinis-equi]|uniref:Fido domain-containing protein n=1 Tax=Marasmius crinis-equi TaxID=585013 RepID=A0ABR3G165_9AGAR